VEEKLDQIIALLDNIKEEMSNTNQHLETLDMIIMELQAFHQDYTLNN